MMRVEFFGDVAEREVINPIFIYTNFLVILPLFPMRCVLLAMDAAQPEI